MNFSSMRSRALGAATLALSLGACDFITSGEGNPNAVPDATAEQLFVAAQVNTFFITEDNTARIAAMWTQQAAGADRQFAGTEEYLLLESDADGEFASPYSAGGLVDLRLAQQKATDEGKIPLRGALKVLEAYVIGRTAALWGDIPYSEAVDPAIAAPGLDEQADVYAAVQTLLDGAIADLGASGSVNPLLDMIYGGDEAAWRRAAYSLKARYYVHWTENGAAGAATACAGNCWDKAAAAAANGILSSADDFMTYHSAAATEENAWYQFTQARSGYVVAGARGVDLTAGDPRRPFLYDDVGDNTGIYVGSRPGEDLTNASGFGVGPSTQMTMIGCAETRLIQAEDAYRDNNFPAARGFLLQAVACEAAKYGVSADGILTSVEADALTGAALLEEILTQKYFANFLTAEPYNDWRRVCLPRLYRTDEVNPVNMPRRLLYGRTERQTNPNIPAPDQQPAANDNDPQNCTLASTINLEAGGAD